MDQRSLSILIFVISVVSGALFEADDLLIAVTQVFRHGERTPEFFYPTDPYKNSSYWDGLGTGQLTAHGKVEAFELGEYFRNRYDDFLSQNYSEEEIYVSSVSSTRNYETAEYFLIGLYPYAEEDIPVHRAPVAVMNSLEECLRWDLILVDVELTNDYFKQMNEDNAEMYAYITEHSLFPVLGLFGSHMILDTLDIENLHNYTLPEWTESVYPQPLTNLSNAFADLLCYTEEQQRLATGGFLNALIEQFEAILSNSSETQKVQLYSAHDVNIACLLNTFESWTPHFPDFASSLIFELRQNSEVNYINAFYKPHDEAIPITLRGCDFNCRLEDFKTIFSNITITELEWDVECFTPLRYKN